MIPEAQTDHMMLVGTLLRSGIVSKKGTKGTSIRTEMGAWLSSSWGAETAKSSIFLPIQIW